MCPRMEHLPLFFSPRAHVLTTPAGGGAPAAAAGARSRGVQSSSGKRAARRTGRRETSLHSLHTPQSRHTHITDFILHSVSDTSPTPQAQAPPGVRRHCTGVPSASLVAAATSASLDRMRRSHAHSPSGARRQSSVTPARREDVRGLGLTTLVGGGRAARGCIRGAPRSRAVPSKT